jgi:hypothetical protein
MMLKAVVNSMTIFNTEPEESFDEEEDDEPPAFDDDELPPDDEEFDGEPDEFGTNNFLIFQNY